MPAASSHACSLARLDRALSTLVALAIFALGTAPARAQLGMGTAFAYQGSLVDGGSPANGSFDFQFLLHDDANAGAQIGSTQNHGAVAVTQGVFTVALDFGAGAFDGDERWLEIHVQPAGGGGFTPLTPRVAIRPAPYALFAKDADTLDGVHASELFERQGESYVVPATTASPTTNAANLQAAYAAAAALAPHGTALSAGNRAVVLVAPGRYDFGTGQLVLSAEFVDVVGLSSVPGDQYLFGTSAGTFSGVVRQLASDVRIENLRVHCTRASGGLVSNSDDPAAYFPDSNLPATIVRNCRFEADEANAQSMRLGIEYSGTYEGCVAGDFSFGARGVASGTFTRCSGGSFAFGGTATGTASGTFLDCIGGDAAFGGGGLATGLFVGCVGGQIAFGSLGSADGGRFLYCVAGVLGFSEDGTPAPRHIFCSVDNGGAHEQYVGND